MKSFLIRPAAALALAVALTACGGSDKAEFAVKGTITGIVYPGVILTTNGMDLAVAPPATPGGTVNFEFPDKLEYGDVYNVVFKQDAENQACGPDPAQIQNNNDTAGRLASIDITLTCILDSYAISGTVTGLNADGLVIANGSNTGTLTVTKPTDTTPFSYSMPAVNFGVTYSITVVKQPTGQTCTVANGTGTMGAAAVTNANITCVNNPT